MMPNTITYTNPHGGAIMGVVGSDRRGSWYGTVWVDGGDKGTSGMFQTEAAADEWVRGQLDITHPAAPAVPQPCGLHDALEKLASEMEYDSSDGGARIRAVLAAHPE